jgi:hypothetical protein
MSRKSGDIIPTNIVALRGRPVGASPYTGSRPRATSLDPLGRLLRAAQVPS